MVIMSFNTHHSLHFELTAFEYFAVYKLEQPYQKNKLTLLFEQLFVSKMQGTAIHSAAIAYI